MKSNQIYQMPLYGAESQDLPRKKILLALFIGIGLIYLAFLKPGIWGIDGNDMLSVAKSLVTEHNFTVPPQYGVPGQNGEYYSSRYLLLPIVAAPFVAVGLGLGHWLGLPEHFTAATFALILSILLTAGTTAFVAGLALRLGGALNSAYFAAISFAFGTMALVYGHTFFVEPLLACITAAGLYLAIGQTQQEHDWASVLAGLAVMAKPTGIILAPILSIYFLSKRYSLRSVLSPLLWAGLGVLLYLAYNVIRFGSLTTSGQSQSQFTTSGVIERCLGLLFSPGVGGGLIWYSLPVILAVIGFYWAYQVKRLEALAVIGVFLGYLLLHSFWDFRGWAWGPRFLFPALPGLLAFTGLLMQKWYKWLLALTLIGFLISAPTLISFYQRYYWEVSQTDQAAQILMLWGDVSDAPLLNAWGAAYRQVVEALQTNIADLVQGANTATQAENTTPELLRIVAVWWWVLPAAGIPVWVGGIVSMLLVGVGIATLRWAWLQAAQERRPIRMTQL